MTWVHAAHTSPATKPVQPHPAKGIIPTAGRPRDRNAIARAFVAKAIYNLPRTSDLLERLASDEQLRLICGWKRGEALPHESAFSRAFAEFAQMELAQFVHQALIEETQQGRLIGHIARDGSVDTRLHRQRSMPLEEMLKELPRNRSIGVNTSSKGHQQYWRGYKLHLDVADGQIPISAVLTGASVHDSQVAIPLATMSASRVQYCYELMDSAYDAAEILEHSRGMGHVPIVDPKAVRQPKSEFLPGKPKRELSWAERDRYLTADQLLRLGAGTS